MKVVSVTDYELMSPTLARVIIAWAGKMGRSEMYDALGQKLQYLAAPVENSFRRLTNTSAIGFIRANREIREFQSPKTLTARYKVMGSNILMDKGDRTLWEVKSGPTGQYIARHGNEDLTELVEAATSRGRGDVPRLSRVTAARAAPSELAAFCTKSGVMDYGFVTSTGDKRCRVISQSTLGPVIVPNTMIASLHQVEIDRELHQQVMAKLDDGGERKKASDYWRTLFEYAPEYAEKLVHYVEEDSVL